MAETFTQRIAAKLPGQGFVRVLKERQSLLYQLVRRDFGQRFVGSAAGWLWTIVHPAVLLFSWVFVFQYCMKVPPPPGSGNNYTLYLFCGYLPWLLFQDTVLRSTTSITEHAGLITKTVFPSEILPVATFLSSLIGHLIALALAVLAILCIQHHFSILILLLPFYTLLLALFALGVGWILSSLQVYLRDTAQVAVVALTGWFWLTPIFIDETQFPAGARFLVRLNPMAGLVKAYRKLLMGYELPPASDLAVMCVVCAGTFLAGGLLFKHLRRGFADVL
ncbi:MAG TPA: ABC transporter permease [Bryobacteraceae bacterium]|nr:ABC transporter permease [Bryobacteraceae bacterium]